MKSNYYWFSESQSCWIETNRVGFNLGTGVDWGNELDTRHIEIYYRGTYENEYV